MSSEQPRDELPEVEPLDEVHRPKHPCPHCGGQNFSRSLRLLPGIHSGGGVITRDLLGIPYYKVRPSEGLLGIIGTTWIEPLHATMCNDCGTIVRLYVLNKDRDWMRWQE
jgi:hypothetical protein